MAGWNVWESSMMRNCLLCKLAQFSFWNTVRFLTVKYLTPWSKMSQMEVGMGEQDVGGVGGCGVHLSPWRHQEFTLRYRSAWRTPAENGQEYLTSGKEYIEPCKNRQQQSLPWDCSTIPKLQLPAMCLPVDQCSCPGDQALSLWSGSTASKTLDYQRTNPREYQIVRTHTKETTWIQDLASPNHQ